MATQPIQCSRSTSDPYSYVEAKAVRQGLTAGKSSLSLALFVRRQGLRPNVSNIEVHKLFEVLDDLSLRRKRVENDSLGVYLDRTAGVVTPPNSWPAIRATAMELQGLGQPKLHLRGKFELWFLVNFVRKVPVKLEQVRPGDPRLVDRTNLNLKNAAQILGPRIQIPDSLKAFFDLLWGVLQEDTGHVSR